MNLKIGPSSPVAEGVCVSVFHGECEQLFPWEVTKESIDYKTLLLCPPKTNNFKLKFLDWTHSVHPPSIQSTFKHRKTRDEHSRRVSSEPTAAVRKGSSSIFRRPM